MSIPQVFDWSGATFKVFGIQDSVEDSITATAGGTKAAAYALSKTYSRVTVVATATDSVLAPYAAVPGAFFSVRNDDSTDALQLFGIGSDTINAANAATGVAVAAGNTATFRCYTAGAWRGPVALA